MDDLPPRLKKNPTFRLATIYQDSSPNFGINVEMKKSFASVGISMILCPSPTHLQCTWGKSLLTLAYYVSLLANKRPRWVTLAYCVSLLANKRPRWPLLIWGNRQNKQIKAWLKVAIKYLHQIWIAISWIFDFTHAPTP